MSEIERTRVGLRIFGKDLVPDKISELLGCSPSLSARVGDRDPRHKRTVRRVKEGFWILDADENDNSYLGRKIEALLDNLTSDLAAWKEITSKFRVDIFCGLFLHDFNEGFDLSPTVLNELGQRNLKIGFDIYSAYEDGEAK